MQTDPGTAPGLPSARIRALPRLLAFTAFVLALASLRYGVADLLSRSSSSALQLAAVRVASDSAGAWLRLADSECEQLKVTRCSQDLGAAIAASPRNGQAWLTLASEQERQGDFGDARASFTRALAMDRTFAPRWAYANFLLRQNDPHVWDAMNRALHVPGIDDEAAAEVFDVCQRMRAGVDVVLNQLIHDDPALLGHYVRYGVASDNPDIVEKTAPLLARQSTRVHGDRMANPTAIEACDYLTAHDRLAAAGSLWSAAVGDARPRGFYNATFQPATLGHGFDWRYNSIPESNVAFDSAERHVRVELSGWQPEYLEMLFQIVPVEPGKRYRVSFGLRSSISRALPGLTCKIYDPETKALLGTLVVDRSGEEWRSESVGFVPPNRFVRVVFAEQRSLGATAFNGTLWLRDLRIESES